MKTLKNIYFIAFLFLSHCYNLSFDNFNPDIVEASLVVKNPTGITTNDTLNLELEIQHPGYIQAITFTGEHEKYEKYINFLEDSQSVTYKKEIPLAYSETFTEENGQYTFDVEVHTKNLAPFKETVTIDIFRESIDIDTLSHPNELTEGDNWNDETFSISAENTGAKIKCVIFPDNFGATPTTRYPNEDDPYSITVPMSDIIPNHTPKSGIVKIISTGGQTYEHDMTVTELNPIYITRDDTTKITDEFDITIHSRIDPADYTRIELMYPSGKSDNINIPDKDSSTTKTISKENIKYNGSTYSIDDGRYPITLKLYKDNNTVEYTLETNFTIFRATVDNLQISTPYSLPKDDIWTTEQLIITADTTGDNISQIAIPQSIHNHPTITTPIYLHNYLDNNNYSLTLDMKQIILKIPNSEEIQGDITITSSKGEEVTDEEIIIEEYFSRLTGDYLTPYDSEDFTGYNDLPDAVKSATPAVNNKWYPVHIETDLYENFSRKKSFKICWTGGTIGMHDGTDYINEIPITSDTDQQITTIYLQLYTLSVTYARIVFNDSKPDFDYTTIVAPTYDLPSTDTGDYLSLGTTSNDDPPSTDSGYIWYPLKIDSSLYADYSYKTSFTLHNDTESSTALSLHNGTSAINSISISDAPTKVYTKAPENSSFKVRIQLRDDEDDTDPTFSYLTIPSYADTYPIYNKFIEKFEGQTLQTSSGDSDADVSATFSNGKLTIVNTESTRQLSIDNMEYYIYDTGSGTAGNLYIRLMVTSQNAFTETASGGYEDRQVFIWLNESGYNNINSKTKLAFLAETKTTGSSSSTPASSTGSSIGFKYQFEHADFGVTTSGLNREYFNNYILNNSVGIADLLNVNLDNILLSNFEYGITFYGYDASSLPTKLASGGQYVASSGYRWIKIEFSDFDLISSSAKFQDDLDSFNYYKIATVDSSNGSVTGVSTSLPNDASKTYYIQIPSNRLTVKIQLYDPDNSTTVELGFIRFY